MAKHIWEVINSTASHLMCRDERNLVLLAAMSIGPNPGRWDWANEVDTNTGFLSACKAGQAPGFLC